MVDVERLLELNPRVSLQRIRRWVEQFAEVMEQPEIVTSLESIIAKLKQRKKK